MKRTKNITYGRITTWLCLSLVLVLSLNSGTSTDLPQGENLQERLSPENTIIAFDIHGVLVKYNKSEFLLNALKNIGILRFVMHQKVWAHIWKHLSKKTPSPEDYFLPLIKDIPQSDKYVPGLFNLFNSHTPIQGMRELVEDIDKQAYEMHIFSNIGRCAYHGWESEDESSKASGLKHKLSDIFKHFPYDRVVTNALKPKPKQYEEFTTNNPNKKIVFIDDMPKNIDAAKKQGWIGILFESPQQVRDELTRHGIISEPAPSTP